MTPRLFRVWLLAAVAGSFLSVAAQTPTPPPVAPQPSAGQTAQPAPAVAGPATAEEMVLPLKLRDAPLELILELLETWTGRTILRPQALPTPTFTLTTKEPLSKAEALRALETLLNLNQIGLVRMGEKFLKVVPLQNVRLESPQIIEGSTLDLPPSGQIVTKLFQFQFLRVNEFLPQVAALLNQNVSQPVIFEKNNAALLTDSITTIQRVEMLVEKLDQPLVSNLSPKFYTIHFAKASDVVNKLRNMLQGQIQNQLGSSTNYSADDRTNQVINIADPRQLVFFDELVAKLDVKSDPNTRTEVLSLKHATAKDVATLLSSLVSGQTKATQNSGSIQPGQIVQPPQGAQPPAPNITPAVTAALGDLGSSQFSSLVTVIADDRSNAVVVNGTVDDLRLIKDLVDKIDIVLAQVRIEVVITEVTLQDNATTGIDTLGLYVVGGKLVGVAGTGNGIVVKGTPTTQAGFDTSFAQLAGSLSIAGNVGLTSTLRKNNATVLSRPTITTTHNKEAKFFVGATRPVINGTTSTPTGSTAGLSTSSSVTQQEIGITLTVKPLIGNDGSVQLDIKQSITDSDPANDVTIDGNAQPTINKRETDSFITIKSGEIIVLGGIVKENKGHQSNRLGPIPWIGDLLGKRTRTLSRTELIIFVRPVVLTNTPADNEAALKQIEGMPDNSAVKKELDPKYEPPKTPLYKKLYQIP